MKDKIWDAIHESIHEEIRWLKDGDFVSIEYGQEIEDAISPYAVNHSSAVTAQRQDPSCRGSAAPPEPPNSLPVGSLRRSITVARPPLSEHSRIRRFRPCPSVTAEHCFTATRRAACAGKLEDRPVTHTSVEEATAVPPTRPKSVHNG